MVRIIFFVLGIFFTAQSFAANGTFIIVKNDVNIQKKDGIQEVAKVGSTISVGDTVVSGADSRAKIAMQDRNIITILPNSRLVIEDYKSSDKEKNVKLSLLEGKVRNDVKEKYDNDKNKFQIRTPTAVAGVRGTKFITSYMVNTKTTEVITLKGEVQVTKFDPNKSTVLGTVTVSQGEKATMTSDSNPPSDPVRVPQLELREADKESKTKKESSTSGSTSPSTDAGNAPPPPRPSTSPTEGITQPNQLPPFLINNPNIAPGKVRPVFTTPK